MSFWIQWAIFTAKFMKFLLGKFAFLETDIQTIIHEHCTINHINIFNSNLKRDFHLISSIRVTSEPNIKVAKGNDCQQQKYLIVRQILNSSNTLPQEKCQEKCGEYTYWCQGVKGYCSKEDIVDITMNLTVPHPVLLVWTWGLWCKNQLGTFSDSGPVKNL